MQSKNVTINSRRTSIRLEPEMWQALKEVAHIEKCKINDICSYVSERKDADTSLTAAVRVFLMLYYKAATTEEGHKRAGHGRTGYGRAVRIKEHTLCPAETMSGARIADNA